MNPELTKGTLSMKIAKISRALTPIDVKYKETMDKIRTAQTDSDTFDDVVDILRTSTGSEPWFETFENSLYDWVDAFGSKLFKSREDVGKFIASVRTRKRFVKPKAYVEHERRASIVDKIKGNERIKINPMLIRSLRIK